MIILDIHINNLLAGAVGGVTHSECLFSEQVKVIWQKYRAVVESKFALAVRLPLRCFFFKPSADHRNTDIAEFITVIVHATVSGSLRKCTERTGFRASAA